VGGRHRSHRGCAQALGLTRWRKAAYSPRHRGRAAPPAWSKSTFPTCREPGLGSRRAQTPLHSVGIEIGLSREGRAGSRVIRMHTNFESSVSAVSSVRSGGSTDHPAPPGCVELAVPRPTHSGSVATLNDADGADAKATGFRATRGDFPQIEPRRYGLSDFRHLCSLGDFRE